MNGSSWRKWDLHVHTKGTNKNDQFASQTMDEFFFRFFKKAYSDKVNGIGITDYFSIENYLLAKKYISNIATYNNPQGVPIFSYEEVEYIKNILLLPNIELRMLPCTDSRRLINIHCIFNPNYEASLEHDFFGELKNQDEFKMNKEGITKYGKHLNPESRNDNEAYSVGIKNFTIDPRCLSALFKKNRVLKNNTLVAVSNSSSDGNSGLQKHYDLFEGDESSLDGVRKSIYEISDIIFSSNDKDVKYFLGKRFDDIPGKTKEDKLEERKRVIKEYGNLKPCIICSDAHKESDLFAKYSWIKGDCTFDGLKQILYEPEHRVYKGDEAPVNPPIKINSVSLSFPRESTIDNESFCFSGDHKIDFSPNYTCLIGGRGTGKSTMLNLIHEALKNKENTFFKKFAILGNDNKKCEIGSCVLVDNNIDEKHVEFLGQNEIEDFAKDCHKLTNAIYLRILKRDGDNLINEKNSLLDVELKKAAKNIDNIINHEEVRLDIKEKERELEVNKKLINSFTSKEYNDINSEIARISDSLNKLKASKKRYESLLEEIDSICKNYKLSENHNKYDDEILNISDSIEEILLTSKEIDFSESINSIETYNESLDTAKAKLIQYLSGKGFTEENQNDISTANISISDLNNEIQILKKNQDRLSLKISEFSLALLGEASEKYKQELGSQVESISMILEGLDNSSIKPISLKLDFDFESAKEHIFNKFKDLFGDYIKDFNIRSQSVFRELLFVISPDKLTNKDELLVKIKSHETTSVAKKLLISIFEDVVNYDIYDLLCKSTFLDYSKYKKINVLYDGRPIESSSFGQRCTAVLVILLLLGNDPIIIDEPEAHLDSLLIFNYLVDVIKEKKKNRQIIFATHNANLVINGDAELIHILNIDNSANKTVINSTTIENPHTRDVLVSLEGGHEAFIKREKKYSIN